MLFSDLGNSAAENGRELGREIELEDAGDLALTEGPGDDDQIEAAVNGALADDDFGEASMMPAQTSCLWAL